MQSSSRNILMPYRSDGKELEELFHVSKEYYEYFGYTVLTFDSGHELFNRSASRNKAVEDTDDEELIIIDADTIVPYYAIEESLSLLKEHDCLIKPTIRTYELLKLDNDLVEKLKGDDVIDQLNFTDETIDLHPGTAWIMRRELFNMVGGFNEDYEEYGFEDLDFTYKCAVMAKVIFTEYSAFTGVHGRIAPEDISDESFINKRIYESTKMFYPGEPDVAIHSKGMFAGSPKEFIDQVFDSKTYLV